MVEKRELEGIIIFETEVFRDDRGYFMEFYNEKSFNHKVLENFSFKTVVFGPWPTANSVSSESE